MVRPHGLLSILCLFLAIYGVKARFCGRSMDNICVPRQFCKIGSENGKHIVEFQELLNGNRGCPSTDFCCPKSEIRDRSSFNDLIPLQLENQAQNPIQRECGHVNKQGLTFAISGYEDLAQEAELPWVVALLDAASLNYKAAGSLIAPDVVLTATHVTGKLNENQLIVRAGEWDFNTNTEEQKHVDVAIRKIIRHPEFVFQNGANNVALLFLAKPLELTRHINLICLPPPNRNFIRSRCIVSGWGKKNMQDNIYMNILKKIEVPVVDSQTCEEQLQVPYSSNFRLDNSLLCAGGEIGKDACMGDGGAPLVCPLQSDPQRYEQAGIVNFGYGCGNPIPAVYTDVSKMRGWIDQQIQANSPDEGGRYVPNEDQQIPNGGQGSVPTGGEGYVPTGSEGYGQGNVPTGGERYIPNGGQGRIPTGYEKYVPNGGQGSVPNGGQGSVPNGGQGSVPTGYEKYVPNGGHGNVPNGDNRYVPNGNQGSVPSGDNRYVPNGNQGYAIPGAEMYIPNGRQGNVPISAEGYVSNEGQGSVPARGKIYFPNRGQRNDPNEDATYVQNADQEIPVGAQGMHFSNGGQGQFAGTSASETNLPVPMILIRA